MITIPEMVRLPNSCHECPFSFWDEENECWCPWNNCTVDYHGGNKMRIHGCPLAESEEQK